MSARSTTCAPARTWARGVHLGNFAEVKNSRLGPDVAHGPLQLHRRRRRSGAGTQHRRGHDHGELRRRRDESTAPRSARAPLSAATRMLVAPVDVGEGAKTGAGAS